MNNTVVDILICYIIFRHIFIYLFSENSYHFHHSFIFPLHVLSQSKFCFSNLIAITIFLQGENRSLKFCKTSIKDPAIEDCFCQGIYAANSTEKKIIEAGLIWCSQACRNQSLRNQMYNPEGLLLPIRIYKSVRIHFYFFRE